MLDFDLEKWRDKYIHDIQYDYSLPFGKYLEIDDGKFAIVITKSQYAIEVGGFTHEAMIADLIKKTRPDIKIDNWGNAIKKEEAYENGNIIIAGYPKYVQVELPKLELLSNNQFEYLKDILYEIKKYNDNNHIRGYGRDYKLMCYGFGNIKVENDYYEDRINELINLLSNYISNDVNIPNEVIIGTSFSNNKKY